MYYLGVDLGTSSVKLVLMESDGKIVKTASREYGLSFPKPGWSEQNPEDWFAGFESGIAEIFDGLDKSKLAGISFGGQMHGLVILDENDNVLRPAILWNDGRTQAECDYLNNEIGREKISAYTANMALTGFTAPKLLWVKKNEPENFAKIAKIMLPKDYLAYRLSGVFATDVALRKVAEGTPWRDAYHDVRDHLERLESEDADAAVLAKRHIGATNGLDWRMYAGRISGLEKEIAKRRKAFDAKIKALFS